MFDALVLTYRIVNKDIFYWSPLILFRETWCWLRRSATRRWAIYLCWCSWTGHNTRIYKWRWCSASDRGAASHTLSSWNISFYLTLSMTSCYSLQKTCYWIYCHQILIKCLSKCVVTLLNIVRSIMCTRTRVPSQPETVFLSFTNLSLSGVNWVIFSSQSICS